MRQKDKRASNRSPAWFCFRPSIPGQSRPVQGRGLAGHMEGVVIDGGVTYVRIQTADEPEPSRLQRVGGALQVFVAESWVALSDGRSYVKQVRRRRCRCAARAAFATHG